MDTPFVPAVNRLPLPGRLSVQVASALRPHGAARRTRIWEIGASLHCSIVGTCLPASELRALVRKFAGFGREDPTDHEIHGLAVGAVAKRDLLAKQIQKALDRRHAVAIRRFHAASCAKDVLAQWNASLQIGDVPGGYWAALTHPMTDEAAVKQMFGDVHMLSHRIGAANRADIRRLHLLEQEKAAFAETIARQERRLRDDISSRDARIRELTELVSASLAARTTTADEQALAARVESLVADLRRQLDRERQRREAAEARTAELMRARMTAEQRCRKLAEENASLSGELEAVEARLAGGSGEPEAAPAWNCRGRRILYVGGRPGQVRHLRALIEEAGGELLHHDGGMEERAEMLYALASRADLVAFPVDCISHAAVLMIKQVCRQTGNHFLPVRRSGVAAFLHALRLCHEKDIPAPIPA